MSAVALLLTGCGSSKKSSTSAQSGGGSKQNTLSLSISESGNASKFTVPASVKGGLVTVTLKNQGTKPHSAQLVNLRGGHSGLEALKIIGSNSPKTPAWLRAEGGVATVPPGQTGTATLNLPPGKYVVADVGGDSGPPANANLNVTPGQDGTLPTTDTTVTGAAPSKDHYKWEVQGALKPGVNRLTFNSKGEDALHFIGAFRISGHHTPAQIIKGLSSNGPPPPFVDKTSFTNTAALDGGRSQVTELSLRGPGTYVLFCPLRDRDGGKPHLAEGMLKIVTVK